MTLGEKLGNYLHVKAFAFSLAVLFLLFILSICVFLFFFATPEEKHTPTGKVIASLHVTAEEKEETLPSPPQPPPQTEETEATPADTQMEAKPLNPTETNPTEEHQTEEHQTEHHITAPPAEEGIPEIEDSIAGLSEETSYGSLPIIRSTDGLKVFDAYKAPFKLSADSKGVISLVMTDYGLSDALSKAALEKLPAYTNLVATPYAINLQSKVSAARNQGKEIWMNIPVQSSANFAENDAGPISLLSGLNPKQNIVRMNTALGHATGYVGIAFTTDSDFEDMSPGIQSIIDATTERGLGIVQLDTADMTIGLAAESSKSPYIQNSIWIDTTLTKDAILKSLAELEKQSIENAYAIAAFHPSPLVFDVVAEWQKSLKKKNIQLAPLTYSIYQKNLVPKNDIPKP